MLKTFGILSLLISLNSMAQTDKHRCEAVYAQALQDHTREVTAALETMKKNQETSYENYKGNVKDQIAQKQVCSEQAEKDFLAAVEANPEYTTEDLNQYMKVKVEAQKQCQDELEAGMDQSYAVYTQEFDAAKVVYKAATVEADKKYQEITSRCFNSSKI